MPNLAQKVAGEEKRVASTARDSIERVRATIAAELESMGFKINGGSVYIMNEAAALGHFLPRIVYDVPFWYPDGMGQNEVVEKIKDQFGEAPRFTRGNTNQGFVGSPSKFLSLPKVDLVEQEKAIMRGFHARLERLGLEFIPSWSSFTRKTRNTAEVRLSFGFDPLETPVHEVSRMVAFEFDREPVISTKPSGSQMTGLVVLVVQV